MKLQPPTMKIDSRGMVFNVPCVRLMPDVGYVQLRESATLLVIASCKQHDYYSFPWRANCGDKIYPRKYKDYGGYFYELCKRMKWFTDCCYTMEAHAEHEDGETWLVFDLTTAVPSNALFGSEFFYNEEDETMENQEYFHIGIEQLVPFADHPFKLYEGRRFDDIVESVRANGVLVPIVVRPGADGQFEILSGHNRVAAAREAGLTEVPAIVREGLTDEEAMLIVTETNLIQRSFADLKHSERAVAIAAHHRAIKHQGKRTDLLREIDELLGTSRPLGVKLDSAQAAGEKYEISSRTISRYLRINELIPALLERLDNGEFALRVGDALSFLRQGEQEIVESVLASGERISIKQADLLKEESQHNELSKAFIKRVFEPGYFGRAVKPVKFSGEFLSRYFTWEQSSEEIEEVVAEALARYFANNI